MKRKRLERTERRRRMPEINLNESHEQKVSGVERPGFAQMFGRLRSLVRPGQNAS